MSKKLIIILVIGILLVGGAYLLRDQRTVIEEWISGKIFGFFTKQFGGGAGSSFSVPEITTAPESFGATPEVNPLDKTNPFKDIQTNPFE